MASPPCDVRVTDSTFASPISPGGGCTRTGTFLRSCRPASTVISMEANTLESGKAEHDSIAKVVRPTLIISLPRSLDGGDPADHFHARLRPVPVGRARFHLFRLFVSSLSFKCRSSGGFGSRSGGRRARRISAGGRQQELSNSQPWRPGSPFLDPADLLPGRTPGCSFSSKSR